MNLYDSLNKLKSNNLMLTKEFTLSVWIYIPPTTDWSNKTSVAILKMNSVKISAKFDENSTSENPLHYLVYGSIILEIVKVNVSQECYWHVKAVSGAWTHLSIISSSSSFDTYYNGKVASVTYQFCNASHSNTVAANFTENNITIGGDISGICIDEFAIWTSRFSSNDVARIYATVSNGKF